MKKQVLSAVNEGRRIAEVSKTFGVSKTQIYNWRSEARRLGQRVVDVPKGPDPYGDGRCRRAMTALASGHTVGQVAKEFGVSVKTIRNWRKRESNEEPPPPSAGARIKEPPPQAATATVMSADDCIVEAMERIHNERAAMSCAFVDGDGDGLQQALRRVTAERDVLREALILICSRLTGRG